MNVKNLGPKVRSKVSFKLRLWWGLYRKHQECQMTIGEEMVELQVGLMLSNSVGEGRPMALAEASS